MKALVLLLLSAPVLADDLVYMSQTMTGTETEIDGGIVLGPYPAQSDVYTIDVQISGPLAPNLNMVMINPAAWTVTGTRLSLSSTPVNTTETVSTSSAVFVFSTDATGRITAWNFAINSTFVMPDLEPGDPPGALTGQGFTNYSSGDFMNSSDRLYSHTFLDSLSAPKGTWTQSSLSNPPPAKNVEVRTCTSSWAPPSNTMGSGIAPNANGSGEECGRPYLFPSTWYIRTTTDGGKTSEWQTLASLGLGKATQ